MAERATLKSYAREASKMLLVAAVYYLAAKVSLQVALVEKNVTPIWPPTGIALVSLLVFGRRLWPGVAAAAFAVNLPISPSPAAAAAIALGNTLAPLLAVSLLRRAGFRKELDRLRDALALVFLGALAGMMTSATVGAGTLVLSGAVPASGFLPTWSVWWTGDAMGVLLFSPVFLSFLVEGFRTRSSWPRRAEAGLLLVCLGLVSAIAFRTTFPAIYLPLPVLVWAAFRLSRRMSVLASLFAATVAVWAAVTGSGPFSDGTLLEKMLTLQVFNATVALTSLVMAVIVTERERVRLQLERAAAELEERVRIRTAELSSANQQLVGVIAERRRSEERLGHSRSLLAEAEQIAQIGSWEWDIPSNLVVWSDEMYRIYGYEPQAFAVSFEKAMERVHPEDIPRISENIERAFDRGEDFELTPIEFRNIRPDGVERILSGSGRLFFENQKPIRMVGTVQDVTERRRTERELASLVATYKSLLDAQSDLGEAVGIVDTRTGRFVFVNGAACQVSGYTEEELLTLDPAGLVAPQAQADMMERRRKRFSAEVVEDRYETKLVRKDGTVIDVEVTAKLIDPTRSLAIYRDISDRKRAERELADAYQLEHETLQRLKELDELKSDFLSTVSHELRTPLTSIQGFSSLLSHRWEVLNDLSRREFNERIQTNAKRLSRLVNELLDFSRLERGEPLADLRPCEVREEILRTIESLDTVLESHQVELEVPSGLTALADPRALSLVLDNLLSNAAKFSPLRSTVTVDAGELDGERLIVSVKDRGLGIPPDQRDRIFERFYRVYRGETAGPGTGIGLAIAKQYAEAQGGTIWVESRSGGGSIFRFTLQKTSEPRLVQKAS